MIIKKKKKAGGRKGTVPARMGAQPVLWHEAEDRVAKRDPLGALTLRARAQAHPRKEKSLWVVPLCIGRA